MKINDMELIKYEDNYLDIKNEMDSGVSSSKFIHSISNRLNNSSNDIFNQGYLIKLDDIVGYLYVSGINKDVIYLEYLIRKEYRNRGYAKKVLNNITDYICENYNIKEIRLNISKDNIASINTALASGYLIDDEDDYNSDKQDYIYDNLYYIDKKRSFK